MFPVWRTKNVLPEANGEVACVHSVVGRVFLDSVEVLHPLATGNPKKKKKGRALPKSMHAELRSWGPATR